MIRTGTITAVRARHPPCEMCSIAFKTMGYFKSTNNQMSSSSPDCITHVLSSPQITFGMVTSEEQRVSPHLQVSALFNALS